MLRHSAERANKGRKAQTPFVISVAFGSIPVAHLPLEVKIYKKKASFGDSAGLVQPTIALRLRAILTSRSYFVPRRAPLKAIFGIRLHLTSPHTMTDPVSVVERRRMTQSPEPLLLKISLDRPPR